MFVGVRDYLNKNPKITTAAAAVVIAAALGGVAYQVYSLAKPPEVKRYFSSDDGESYFAASETLVPPADYRGKTAVRAIVYDLAGEKKIGYLERFTSAGKALVEQQMKDRAAGKPDDAGVTIRVNQNEIEVKRPGEPKWIPITDRKKYYEITLTPVAPDGTAAVTVEPE